MVAARNKNVGRFKVEVELANNDDMAAVRRGDLSPDKVRKKTILGVVDSGAARLVLPTAVAKDLGLDPVEKVNVKYADGRTARRDRIAGVYLKLLGRDSVYMATLEPKRDTALIGALVLEDLDLLIDPLKMRLYPRDPKGIVSEIE